MPTIMQIQAENTWAVKALMNRNKHRAHFFFRKVNQSRAVHVNYFVFKYVTTDVEVIILRIRNIELIKEILI